MIRDLTDEEARRALVLKWGTVEPDVLPAWVAEMDYALAVRWCAMPCSKPSRSVSPAIPRSTDSPGSARRTPSSPGVTGAGPSIPDLVRPVE